METLTSLNIKVNKVEESRLPEVDFSNLKFGHTKSDHMFIATYRNGKWGDLEIKPYQDLRLSPACIGLHYGQSIFEGMKAFRNVDGRVSLFRPRANWHRMHWSGERMAMAPIPEDIFMEGLKTLLELDQAWVPDGEEQSLYIRPLQFADEPNIGVHSSETYTFLIFTCPAGKYYDKAVGVWVEDTAIRAARGGVGNVKAAGNYGPTLLPAQQAQDRGYRQILWTQKLNDKYYAQEIGTMNFFVQINDKLITPKLDGTILEGITRDSIIQLARHEGFEVEEAMLNVRDIFDAAKEGRLKDAFGVGTAAVVTFIDRLGYHDEEYFLPPVEERTASPLLKKRLNDIRSGRAEDIFGWMEYVT